MSQPERQSAAQPSLPRGFDWSEPTRRLGLDGPLAAIAARAPERDRQRILLHDEVALLKRHGIGGLRLPASLGGADLPLPAFFAVIRDIARAESNLAHSLRNHFTVVERHRTSPEAPDSRRILALAAAGQIFGTANSDPAPAVSAGTISFARTGLSPEADGWRLDSVKDYTTGNIYADQLIVMVPDQDGRVRQLLLPRDRAGVSAQDDWRGFGQKLTGSGRTVFRQVRVEPGDLLAADRRAETHPGFYSTTYFQIYLTTVIIGICGRIRADALDLVRNRRRNYYHGQAEAPRDEPALQSAVGRIAALGHGAEAMGERAVAALDQAWAGIDRPEGRALSLAATIAAAEAKVAVEEAALTLANLLLDVGSGSALAEDLALDRHWRNIRAVAAHNPRLYKERILGDYYLNGTPPPTGIYF